MREAKQNPGMYFSPSRAGLTVFDNTGSKTVAVRHRTTISIT
ncbi:Protein of unknown function [Pyronema omphalodes CBS 100304]|uniref:Uncharacterized protein n=1 Tax=Pyronema omphalodes (strain CBS 100304) TaxID=1076935 RepID=U4LHP0_PYROM|nr:Protein of unknown function [Pyronema omphalodes CBS 100304]